jgi:hypothetical protein
VKAQRGTLRWGGARPQALLQEAASRRTVHTLDPWRLICRFTMVVFAR